LKKVVLDVAIKIRKISEVSLIRARIITIIILTLIFLEFEKKIILIQKTKFKINF